MSNKFAIPPEFEDAIEFRPVTDPRSDAEILAKLDTFRPVVSERNVWAFWDSGLLNMPAWQKKNVCDWDRLCGDRWAIRVLDSVPSSNNYALKHIPRDQLPACFSEGTMDGPYVGHHSADFLRGAALTLHGGIWSDVGLILLRTFDEICWDKIEDPDTPYNVCVALLAKTMAQNFFVASRKGDPFIRRWHECFMAIWEGKANNQGISYHPLIANTGIDLDSSSLLGDRFTFDLSVPPRRVFEYAAQMICWMRMCMCEGSPADPFNATEYWKEKILVFDSLGELLMAESQMGWVDIGPKLFDLLSSPIKSATDLSNDKTRIMWRVITNASGMKVSRSKNIFKAVGLGALWDLPENAGKDNEPGTYGELLRYASLNFTQTRKEIAYLTPHVPERTIQKGCLEV